MGSTPDVWSGLVTLLFEDIKRRCDEMEIEYPEVFQIKEKLGGLRIYCRCKDEMIQGWISGTVQMANRGCERCGNSAMTQLIGGLYATLCCYCAHDAARHTFVTIQIPQYGFTHIEHKNLAEK